MEGEFLARTEDELKIFVLKGSPRAHGTSNTLVAEFKRGAEEAGHQVATYDCARDELHPCHGCGYCRMNGECVQTDACNRILQKLISYDMVVLATPLYYFGMSAQLKILIDRFYARNEEIIAKHMKAAVIATAGGGEEGMRPLQAQLHTLFKYLDFQDMGMLFATSCPDVDSMPKHYLEEAYQMGRGL
jgi:multimeric flavodoxin WrbA